MRQPLPTRVASEIERDWGAVKPIASPGTRALRLLPLGIVLLIASPVYWGWRSNLGALSPWMSWGLSAIEVLAGGIVLLAAFCEAVPGRELSRSALSLLGAATALLFVAVTLVTHSALPNVAPSGIEVRYAWECIGMAALFSVPALVVPAWLVARAMPGRPALTGALCGLGVGLMEDSGVRLFCWVTEPVHVLASHGGAIVLLMVLGAASATVVELVRSPTRADR
jgi:hypothetical protein